MDQKKDQYLISYKRYSSLLLIGNHANGLYDGEYYYRSCTFTTTGESLSRFLHLRVSIEIAEVGKRIVER